MRAVVLWLVLGLSFSANAKAPTLKDGIAAFERGKYERARTILADIVAAGTAPEGKEGEARLYLAASHHALGDMQRAYEHLLELKRRFPEQKVDPYLFVPDFVALAQKAEFEVEQEKAAAAAKQKEEEDRLKAEEAQRLAQQQAEQEQAQAQQVQTAQPPPSTPSSFALHAGVQGFSDVMGARSVGATVNVTAAFGSVEVGARSLLGSAPAFGLEVAYALPLGGVQPRVGVRGTVSPMLTGGTGLGGGAFVGARVPIAGGLSLLADAGVEALSVPEGYQPLAVLLAVGVDYAFVGAAR